MSQIQFVLVAAFAGACWRGEPALVAPHPPRIVVATAAPAPRATQLTAHSLIATIRASYLVGLQRCYTQQLKKDPGVRGLVTVTMTVGANGRLSARRAEGLGSRVESCVERQMRRWEFPPATTEDGRPGDQSFRFSLQLSSQ